MSAEGCYTDYYKGEVGIFAYANFCRIPLRIQSVFIFHPYFRCCTARVREGHLTAKCIFLPLRYFQPTRYPFGGMDLDRASADGMGNVVGEPISKLYLNWCVSRGGAGGGIFVKGGRVA